jgi:hypothetical protein
MLATGKVVILGEMSYKNEFGIIKQLDNQHSFALNTRRRRRPNVTIHFEENISVSL